MLCRVPTSQTASPAHSVPHAASRKGINHAAAVGLTTSRRFVSTSTFARHHNQRPYTRTAATHAHRHARRFLVTPVTPVTPRA